jgi:ABC-type xylose transport system permease subunit
MLLNHVLETNIGKEMITLNVIFVDMRRLVTSYAMLIIVIDFVSRRPTVSRALRPPSIYNVPSIHSSVMTLKTQMHVVILTS